MGKLIVTPKETSDKCLSKVSKEKIQAKAFAARYKPKGVKKLPVVLAPKDGAKVELPSDRRNREDKELDCKEQQGELSNDKADMLDIREELTSTKRCYVQKGLCQYGKAFLLTENECGQENQS